MPVAPFLFMTQLVFIKAAPVVKHGAVAVQGSKTPSWLWSNVPKELM